MRITPITAPNRPVQHLKRQTPMVSVNFDNIGIDNLDGQRSNHGKNAKAAWQEIDRFNREIIA